MDAGSAGRQQSLVQTIQLLQQFHHLCSWMQAKRKPPPPPDVTSSIHPVPLRENRQASWIGIPTDNPAVSFFVNLQLDAVGPL